MAINKGRMDPKLLRKNLTEGRLMWDFSLEAIEEQCNENRYFGLEHPERASSWKLPKTQRTLQRPDVAVIIFDMCSWGLTVADDELSRKSTRIATNNPWLAYELMLAQCDGLHSHRHLIGGLPALAQEYPPELCKCIARSTKKAVLQEAIPSFIQSSFSGFEEDEEEIPDDIPENDQGSFEPDTPRVSESQKRLIHRVHVNVGHPPRDRFLRALRAAGALPHVLQYVRNDFRCDDREVRHGPAVHRKAQLPKTFSFNKVVCLDFFYISWQDQQVAIMNMVDLGTGFQVAVRAPAAEGTHGGTPTSAMAWRLFVTTWVRYYGAPQMIMCDAGNEFMGLFERGLENMGILQHVIHVEAPWENGRAERHGGWLKTRVERELQSGRSIIVTLEDLDELLSAVTSSKNNWLNKRWFHTKPVSLRSALSYPWGTSGRR